MGSSLVNLFRTILNILAAISNKDTQPDNKPIIPPDNTDEPTQVTTSRVLLLVYDPIMDSNTGKKLSELRNWHSVEELTTMFITDITQSSNNLARYQVVERIDVDEFPAKVDGFRYTPSTYLDVLSGKESPYMPQEADYQVILKQFDIPEKISNDEIDEVWIFGFPHAGFLTALEYSPALRLSAGLYGGYHAESAPLAGHPAADCSLANRHHLRGD